MKKNRRAELLAILTSPYYDSPNSEQLYVDDKAKNIIDNLIPYVEMVYLEGYNHGTFDSFLSPRKTLIVNTDDTKEG